MYFGNFILMNLISENVREELQARIKAILEPQQHNETGCCVSEHGDSSQPESDGVDPSKEHSHPTTIHLNEAKSSQDLEENEDPRSTLNNSRKVPVENESYDSSNLIGQTDTQKNKICRQHSLTQNLNRKSLENEKHYVEKEILYSRQSSDDENVSLDHEHSVQADEDSVKSRDPFPQDYGINNDPVVDDKNILSLGYQSTNEHGGFAVTISGNYQECDSSDKPAVTLSGKYGNSPCTEEIIPKAVKHVVEVCTDVTLPGFADSEHFKNCGKLFDSVRGNQTIGSEKVTVPKPVPMSPIQVSEEPSQSHSCKQDKSACPESPPKSLSHNINYDMQSSNDPSKRMQAFSPTDYPTCTENAGLIIHETPTEYEGFHGPSQNNPGDVGTTHQTHQSPCQCSENNLDTDYQQTGHQKFHGSNQNNEGITELHCRSAICGVGNTHQAHQSSYQSPESHLDTDYQPPSHPQTQHLLITTPSSYTESQDIYSNSELLKVNGSNSPPMAECPHENNSNVFDLTKHTKVYSEEETRDNSCSRDSGSSFSFSTVVECFKSLE
jgi:hypothetical protein